MDETPENFKERMKVSYKREVNEMKLQEWKGVYIYKYKYEGIVPNITEEDFKQREQEAQTEWKDFCREKMKERIHINKEIDMYTNTRTKERGYEIITNHATRELTEIKKLYQKIARAKRLIEEQIKDDYKEDEFDANDQERIVDILQDYITMGIEKLKNKEKVQKMTNNVRALDDFKTRKVYYQITKNFNKDMGFAYVVSCLINQKVEMLETINPQHELIKQRSDNQDTYVKEYLEYCDTEFLTKRIKNVLSENLSFGTGEMVNREKLMEEMSPKIIKIGKETLYKNLQKEIPNQGTNFSRPLPNNLVKISNQAITFPISLPKAMGHAKRCLFPSGYSTALKFLYPNDEERIPIRQYFLQTISKELLTEIESRLLSETAFSPVEYSMRESLLYIYKRYGGTENLGVDVSLLKEKYYEHQKKSYKHLLDGWEEKVGNSKDVDKLYPEIRGIAPCIKQYTFFFLKNTPTHIQRIPKK